MALQLAGMIAFALSFHTIFTVFSNAVSGEAFNMEMTVDQSKGTGTLMLSANPRNDGLLGVDLSIELSVVDEDGEYLATNSTSGYIGAGGQQPIVLSLTMPADEIQGLQEEEVFLQIALDVRTLENLVGISNTFRLQGGEGE